MPQELLGHILLQLITPRRCRALSRVIRSLLSEIIDRGHFKWDKDVPKGWYIDDARIWRRGEVTYYLRSFSAVNDSIFTSWSQDILQTSFQLQKDKRLNLGPCDTPNHATVQSAYFFRITPQFVSEFWTWRPWVVSDSQALRPRLKYWHKPLRTQYFVQR